MSAKNALKGYVYQVNVLNAFVAKMDLKRNIKDIESEAEVKHEFDDMVVIDENDNLRNAIESKYGISIKYGSETEGYKVDTLSTVSLVDKEEINKALIDMQNTINLFPNDLFWELKNNGYPLTIYLIKNYSNLSLN